MCGICGIISQKQKVLDKRALCILGVNNDARGGDACGILIDDKVEYGLESEKKNYFINFFQESELLKSTYKSQLAMVHCRKASVGGKNDNLAQPYCIYDENGKIQFAVLHNGTIKNHEALCKKYLSDIDTKDMNDTQILGNIFYRYGYDVLGEYIGAGVFITVDYRNDFPVIRFFKGGSKEHSYSKVEEERPLYYVITKQGDIIFSSISAYLWPLYPKETVYILSYNKLFIYDYENSKFIIEKEYDRSAITQQAYSYAATNGAYYNNSYNTYNTYGYSYNNHEEYLERKRKEAEQEKKEREERRKDTSKNKDKQSMIIFNQDEMLFYQYTVENKNYSSKKLAHGIYKCDLEGNINKECENKEDTINSYPFWNGLLLYNIECFHYLAEVAKECFKAGMEIEDVYPYLIPYLSAYPCRIEDSINPYMIFSPVTPFTSPAKEEMAVGHYDILFHDMGLSIVDGYLELSKIPADEQEALNAYKALNNFKLPESIKQYFL